MGCMEEPKVEITRMEISNQADIDFICDNLPDGDTFNGVILIDSEEELDYKCLRKIKHINGDLILNAPGASRAFRDIETIVGIEVFAICDESVDTMNFPNLRIVNTGISIHSWCNFSNVLYIPNIEKLNTIGVSSAAYDSIARTGTFMGFDKIEEMTRIRLESSNGLPDNIKIDGFGNLKKVLFEFRIANINEAMEISEKSFNKLEEVGYKLRLEQNSNSKSDLTLEYLFPNLKMSEKVELLNFAPEDACYLEEHLASGDIAMSILNTVTFESYGNEELLDLCE